MQPATVCLVHDATGKRYRVSARASSKGNGKDVTVGSIKTNFAPLLKVAPHTIRLLDEFRYELEDDTVRLLPGCSYTMTTSAAGRAAAAAPVASATAPLAGHSHAAQHSEDPSASHNQSNVSLAVSVGTAAGGGPLAHRASSRSASAAAREALVERCRELESAKARLQSELEQVSSALETSDRPGSGAHGPHWPPQQQREQPQRGWRSDSNRGRSAEGERDATQLQPHGNEGRRSAGSPSRASSRSSAPAAATSASGLGEQMSDLEYQIGVVESLLEEDSQKWALELSDLEQKLQQRRRVAINELDEEARECADSAARIEGENEALASDVERLRRDLEQSTAEAARDRRDIERAITQLEASQKGLLDLIEKTFGSSTEKDREMAAYLASSATRKNMVTATLENLVEENSQLRAEYEATARERKTLHKKIEDAKGNIRVVVRMRPVLPSDDAAPHHVLQPEEGAIEANEKLQTVFVSSPTTGLRNYEFYAVYGPSDDSVVQQGTIFEEQVVPLLDSVFDGRNSCVIAYGQTGSGKSWTIIGETADGNLTGLLPQSVEYLFDPSRSARLSQDGLHEERIATVSMTMIELYMDSVRDLSPLIVNGSSTSSAAPRKCEVRQVPGVDGVTVAGAAEVVLRSWENAMDLIQRGISARQTHRTLRNPVSSRSHLILTVNVTTSDGHRSRLMFVDLAGSERVSRSLSHGERLKEAQHINKSLSALGDVVASLTTNPNGHIPYRNSKLTQILQSCIGGTAKTLMITCVCPHIPHQHNLVETLSTLKFASRAKLVRNNIGLRRSSMRQNHVHRDPASKVANSVDQYNDDGEDEMVDGNQSTIDF